MDRTALGQYATLIVAVVLAGVGFATYFGRLNSAVILMGIAIVAVGISSFLLGQWSVDVEFGYREKS